MNFLRFWIFVLFAAVKFDSTHAVHENARAVLNYSNILRWHHGCPPLIFDEKLSIGCKAYAKELAKLGALAYSDPTNTNYTENVNTFGLKPNGLKFSVQKWYTGDRFDMMDDGAHEFTALIWRSSRLMGYGDAMVSRSTAVMVVRYTPPGNVRGRYTENVPPRLNDQNTRKRKRKQRWEMNSAIRQANRSSLNLFTVLIVMLLFSYFLN